MTPPPAVRLRLSQPPGRYPQSHSAPRKGSRLATREFLSSKAPRPHLPARTPCPILTTSMKADDEERVILVDESDNEVGTETKPAAHSNGKLHRAVSVFVFNDDGMLLLQRRAASKYHSANLWSNTCCGHPRPGESAEAAAHRRLHEEMGFDTPLRFIFNFIYRAELENGLSEHEFDHVLVGRFDGTPVPSSEEVDDWRWASVDEVNEDVRAHPQDYTTWFKIALERLGTLDVPEIGG